MEHTHNGFYEELDELQKDGADDFGFLENICISVCDIHGNQLSTYDLLHGYCTTFATLLHKKYGYTVYKIEKKNGDYIHCFCTAIWNGITYYIDVRGITNNYDEFISEFEDFVSKEESLQYTVPVENFKNDYPFAMELASKVESYFKEYYDFELFQKETELMRRLS